MIPGFDLAVFAHNAGPIAALLVVMAIIFAESGILFGFFLPGDSIIFTLGLLIQGTDTITIGLNIHVVVFFLFVAAVLGDNVGYAWGKKLGPVLFKRPDSLLFRKENIQKAQIFYEKYGAKTIILARFVPIVRTFAPLVAGIGKMDHKTFTLYNLIGGALWAAGVTYLGYFLGFYLRKLGVDVDTILLPIICLIVLVSASPAIYQFVKTKEKRQATFDFIKSQAKKIFKHKK